MPDLRGHYPVLVADPTGGLVTGRLHSPGGGFGVAELAEMDAFEGYLPGDPGRSDYLRRPLPAALGDGREAHCEAYVWNRAVDPDFAVIPHGNFARYLAESGVRPLPG